MKPGKKFYKRPRFVVVIVVLLLAAIAVPTALTLTKRRKTRPGLVSKQNKQDTLELITKLTQLASVKPEAITGERLADICEAMESAFRDISVEYEWYIVPPETQEEAEAEMGIPMLVPKDGLRRYKFSAAGLLGRRDPNDPNEPLPERFVGEESETTMYNGRAWDCVTRHCYNGKIAKELQVDYKQPPIRTGSISRRKRFMVPMNGTPIGFSVLRLSFSDMPLGLPLSALLRRKEFVHLDNTVQDVNGFNTMRADFLTQSSDPNRNKMVYLRVYFSVDHGYTPVRYEHMGGKKVALGIEVNSLEQVANGLWFPSSGLIGSPDEKQSNVYIATSKIIVNQGLTDEYFDIDFPPGTRVFDKIKNTVYIVKPTKEQKEKFEKEQQWEKEHADELAALDKEGGRNYSALRLRRLGQVENMYVMEEEKYPKRLEDLKLYFSSGKDKEIFPWILKNVEYLGAALERDKVDISKTPIAYDKTLLKKGEGTNVLFVNGAVKFCRPDELKELGITKH